MRKPIPALIGLLTLAASALILKSLLPTTTPSWTVTPAPEFPTNTPTATITAYQPCYYVWAYKDLPEITSELQTAIQRILPEAEARATAFGENCVSQDGSATFGAMQTDFYVRILVTDLNDDVALGNLIEQVLPIIDQFPRQRLLGPNDGFVEFAFFLLGDAQRVVRVPIPLGKQLREQGLHGAELLRAIESQ